MVPATSQKPGQEKLRILGRLKARALKGRPLKIKPAQMRWLYQTVTGKIVRWAEVEMPVEGIGPSIVVGVFGKCVVRQHRQAATEPLFDIDLQAVVMRIVIRGDQAHGAEILIEPPLLRVVQARSSRNVDRGVGLAQALLAVREERSLVADIRDADYPVGAKLPLIISDPAPTPAVHDGVRVGVIAPISHI
jgi:hypothetical protein